LLLKEAILLGVFKLQDLKLAHNTSHDTLLGFGRWLVCSGYACHKEKNKKKL